MQNEMIELASLTQPEQEFVQENESADPARLLLQGQKLQHLPLKKLVHYIQARQKIKQKLPDWYRNLQIIYPPTLSLEQSSSEITAAFKAELVAGNILIDLTGGFGIDSYYFAKKINEVIYVERQAELAAVTAYNALVLGAKNITFHTADAAEFLNIYTGTADWIYLDPARRDNRNQKVHLLADCEPDIVSLLPLLLTKGKNILLKASPMLDINQAIQDLRQVQKIYVVAVENECKEVLYHLSAHAGTNPQIETYNLLPGKESQYFGFTYADEEDAAVTYSLPLTFIYEPNAAILKAGGFKSLANHFALNKLHRSSHLYTSENIVQDFPGRIFKLKRTSRYQKKELASYLPDQKANITVRNFPDSVAAIRKKTGLKEGGDQYLFATTDLNAKIIILICEKADGENS